MCYKLKLFAFCSFFSPHMCWRFVLRLVETGLLLEAELKLKSYSMFFFFIIIYFCLF